MAPPRPDSELVLLSLNNESNMVRIPLGPRLYRFLNRIPGIKRCKKVVDIKQEKEILTDPYAMFMYAIKSPLN